MKEWIVAFYRHLKNSGFSTGIQTHDLCDAGAMLYQLSCETTQLGAGQFVGLICSREKLDEWNEMNVYLKSGLQTKWGGSLPLFTCEEKN